MTIQTVAGNANDELHYPLGDAVPPPGTALRVARGVHWLRMPLPFALDHVNLWLLDDVLDGAEGFTAVDCGIDDRATRALWERIFAGVMQGRPLLRVVVTHMHPDHIGLAHWLCERFSTPQRECRLWISATDWNAARLGSQSTSGVGGESAARFFARHGLTDGALLQQVRERTDYYARMVPQVPARFRRLMDGLALSVGGDAWRCIAGHGHAPEHMALHRSAAGAGPDLLISGDMLLPRITTNVSVVDLEPEADPLPLYLASIDALRRLDAGTLVLPSHGRPFVGLHPRITQLHRHHEARLAEVLAACTASACSAADLLPVLFRRALDLHQTLFAMGEALAHLHSLAGAGRLAARDTGDGVLRFVALS